MKSLLKASEIVAEQSVIQAEKADLIANENNSPKNQDIISVSQSEDVVELEHKSVLFEAPVKKIF